MRDSSPAPSPAPTTRPLVLVESGQLLTHRLRLVDESTTTRRSRSAGVRVGDLVTSVNARAVGDDLSGILVPLLRSGETISIDIMREGRRLTIVVQPRRRG